MDCSGEVQGEAGKSRHRAQGILSRRKGVLLGSCSEASALQEGCRSMEGASKYRGKGVHGKILYKLERKVPPGGCNKKLRASSNEEAADAKESLKELEELEEDGLRKKEYKVVPQRRTEEAESKGWKADETTITKSRFGRGKREAQQMVRGLRSMKKVIKEPFLKRRYNRRQKQAPHTAQAEEPAAAARARSLSYEPSIAPDEVMEREEKTQEGQDREDEEFWKEVADTEAAHDKEETEK